MPKYRARVRDFNAWRFRPTDVPPSWVAMALVSGRLVLAPAATQAGIVVMATKAVASVDDWLVEGPLGIEVWKPHLFAVHYVAAP